MSLRDGLARIDAEDVVADAAVGRVHRKVREDVERQDDQGDEDEAGRGRDPASLRAVDNESDKTAKSGEKNRNRKARACVCELMVRRRAR